MRHSDLEALVSRLRSRYREPVVISDPSSRGQEAAAPGSGMSRQRKRHSAIDRYRGIAEAFVTRRNKAADPSAYTYERLQRMISKSGGPTFSVSALQRRLTVWGIVDGMRRYKK